MNGKIIEFNDIRRTIKQYNDFIVKQDISIEELNKLKIEEINSSNLTEDEKRKAIYSSRNVYSNAFKNSVKQMLTQYFTMQITNHQITVDENFNFVDEKLKEIEKEFSIGLSMEDRYSIALDVIGATFEQFATYSTMNFDDKEKALIEERAKISKENLKKSRAFGRDTKVSDTLEVK